MLHFCYWFLFEETLLLFEQLQETYVDIFRTIIVVFIFWAFSARSRLRAIVFFQKKLWEPSEICENYQIHSTGSHFWWINWRIEGWIFLWMSLVVWWVIWRCYYFVLLMHQYIIIYVRCRLLLFQRSKSEILNCAASVCVFYNVKMQKTNNLITNCDTAFKRVPTPLPTNAFVFCIIIQESWTEGCK